jgi:hypothetical protein
MHLLKQILTVLACALAYYSVFYFNKYIFNEYVFSFGVNWVFIPSGLQLVLVLTAIESAAVGIVLASWIIGYTDYFLGSLIFTFITGLITGVSPLISRKISFDFLHIEEDLRNLTFNGIAKMSVIFALIRAVLHQLWFFYNNVSERFLHSTIVMAIGNLLGTILVLSLIKVTSETLRRRAPPFE